MRFYSLFFIHCYVRNLYLASGDVFRPQHKNVQPKLRQNTELIISPCFSFLLRSISWICWCFYTVSSLTVSKVHCSFNERLMLKEYLIKCFIVRCFRKSYFWCYETSIFFSRESPFFPRLGKHYVSKEFWFLILFSEKKNEIPEGFYFRGENNVCVSESNGLANWEKLLWAILSICKWQ